MNRIENRNNPVLYRKRGGICQSPYRYRDEEKRCEAACLPRQRPPGIVPCDRTGNRHAAAGSKYCGEVPAGSGLD